MFRNVCRALGSVLGLVLQQNPIISRVVQDSARSDQPYKSFTKQLTFQNFVRGQIFGPLVLLDEEAESLRYFFGAKL